MTNENVELHKDKIEAKTKGIIEQELVKPRKQYTKRVEVMIFEDKRCYKKSDWPKEQIDYWLRNGYQELEQWDIETGKPETYLLKPRFNESPSHLFMVCRIAEYLQKASCKVWLFETNQPDIIFEAKDCRKVAVEVEPGIMLEKKPRELKKRVKLHNRTYGRQNWFFVLTNKELLGKYQQLGTSVTRKEVIPKLQEYLKLEKMPEITLSG